MKITNNIRKITVLLITAVMLLGCFFTAPEVWAAGTSYRKVSVYFITYDKHGKEQRSMSADMGMPDGDRCKFYPFMSDSKVQIFLDNLTDCTYTSLDPDILELRVFNDDNNTYRPTAELICRKAGNATVQIDVPGDETYEARTIYCDLEIIKISRLSLRFFRRITADGKVTETAGSHFLVPGETDNDSISFSMDDCGAGIRLEGTEGVNTVYSSSDESILTIDSATGDITLKSPGQAVVTADVPEDNYYKAGKFHCKVTVTPSSSESGNTGSDTGSGTDTGAGTGSTGGTAVTPAAPATPAKPAVKTAAVTIPKLTKPTLKCSKRMKKANKLTWSKVAKASGYQLYIKYPGKKKYVKALTKNSTVKSVTHRGLKRKKYYYYKLRAYVKVGGKYYYGPFSKAIKVKVK